MTIIPALISYILACELRLCICKPLNNVQNRLVWKDSVFSDTESLSATPLMELCTKFSANRNN